MPQFNIHEFERRSDWPLLVTAVPCRTCEAQPGSLCCDVGMRKISGQIVTRTDYHAERKYDAVQAWYMEQDRRGVSPVTPVSSPQDSTSPQEDTGVSLGGAVSVAALVDDLLDHPLVTNYDDPVTEFQQGSTGGAGAGGDWTSQDSPEAVPEAPEPEPAPDVAGPDPADTPVEPSPDPSPDSGD